jgi:hypothetical protein
MVEKSRCAQYFRRHTQDLYSNAQYVILVGGFGESPYLKMKLSELFDQPGASIVAAEEPSSVPPFSLV